MGEELANAKQAIGHYMCAYSDAAFELGETLKVLFGIKDKPMADAIVVALGDFSRQVNLAWALCQDARNADGTELSQERKEQIDKTMSDCFKCNDDRVKLAHGRLEPRADGSVAIVKLRLAGGELKGRDPTIWSPTDCIEKSNKLTELADELRNFQKELSTIKIQVPTGWLSISDDRSAVAQGQRASAALIAAAFSGSKWVPRPPSDETKK
jgi:hypothetical protein